MSTVLKNMVLIAGTGRNVGKTTLGCHLVKQMSVRSDVWAIKVCSHFHKPSSSLKMLHCKDGLLIFKEQNKFSNKDSSRYFESGANEALYVQARDLQFVEMVKWVTVNIPPSVPVICESGGLGDVVVPGLAFFINGGVSHKTNLWDFPYVTLKSENGNLIKMPNVIWDKSFVLR